MRVFSIVNLAFLLVVREADGEQVCPSLAVEKEKCETEKQDALTAVRETHRANISAMQAEAGELRKKLEKERDQCVESLEKEKSVLHKCNKDSETWKKTMTEDMEAKETKHEASLTKLRKQVKTQTAELKKGEADLAKLSKTLEKKDQELAETKEAIENLKAAHEKEIESLRSEKESLIKSHVEELESVRTEGSTMSEALKEKADEIKALKADAESRADKLKNELSTKTDELKSVSKELSNTKEKFKELRHQNTEVLKKNSEYQLRNKEILEQNTELKNQVNEVAKKHEDATIEFEEQTKLLKKWEDQFTSIRARHVKQTEKLKKKAESEQKRLKKEIKNMRGDVLFAGSWIQVPKGWNGVLAIDLRLFQKMGDLCWSRVLGGKKISTTIPKEYRNIFSNCLLLLEKIPSLDDLHLFQTLLTEKLQGVWEFLVKEYTPLLEDAVANAGKWWKVGSAAGRDFYQTSMQPHLEVVSSQVNKLYVENDFGPLYVDPAFQKVAETAQPVYKDTIYPLYQDYVLRIIENIPQYRSHMETVATRLQKDLRGGWRMTKKYGRVVQSEYKKRFAFMKRSYALLFSTVSIEGKKLVERFSTPLVLLGGKVKFEGGVFEAASVVTGFLSTLWFSSRFMGVQFRLVRVIFVSAYTVTRFVVVTVLLKLVVYTVAWRLVLLGSIMSLLYVVSFLLRIIGFAIKVVFFPVKIALKLVKCILKCMCCCGLCCRGKSKPGKSTTKGSVGKAMNGKKKKVTLNDSSTSSDEGKTKKGKKRGKKVKKKADGSKVLSKSEKKRRKRGGK